MGGEKSSSIGWVEFGAEDEAASVRAGSGLHSSGVETERSS